MSNFVIPDELTFERVGQMYPSVKTEYRRQPTNNTKFSNGDIQLPLNKMMYSFMNPATAVVNFSVKYYIQNTTANVETGLVGAVMGSAYSHFQRQVLKSLNGGVIETIDRPDLLTNMIMNCTLTPQEKAGMINLGFSEYKTYTNMGTLFVINDVAGNSTEQADQILNFSIPLIGAFNCNKLINLSVSDMELDLTLNNITEFIRTAVTGIQCVSMEIYDVELVYDVLTLEQEGYNALMSSLGGVMEIKTTSYKYGSAQLPLNANRGTYEIVMPHQVNSLKKFFWYCSPSDNTEGNYGGVNPNLQDYALIVNSTSYPQQRVKVPKLAEAYYQVSKSFGAVYSGAHSGSLSRTSFGRASTANYANSITGQYLEYYSTPYVPGDLGNTVLSSSKSNKFYQVIDLEKINQLKNSIYSGINSKGTTNTFILNIGENLKQNVNHAIHFWSEYDMVLTFDTVNQMVVVAE